MRGRGGGKEGRAMESVVGRSAHLSYEQLASREISELSQFSRASQFLLVNFKTYIFYC